MAHRPCRSAAVRWCEQDGVYVRNTAAKGGVKGPGVGNTGR